MREVAISAGGGSLGTLFGLLARDFVFGSPEAWDSFHNNAALLAVPHTTPGWNIHWPSLIFGVVIGFLVWPLIELAYLVRQCLTIWLKLRLQRFLRGSGYCSDSLHRKLG